LEIFSMADFVRPSNKEIRTSGIRVPPDIQMDSRRQHRDSRLFVMSERAKALTAKGTKDAKEVQEITGCREHNKLESLPHWSAKGI
jgi:hypothetical protein